MTSRRNTGLLACALALCALGPSAATPAPGSRHAKPADAAGDAAAPLADFAMLSGARPLACDAPPDPRLAALGQPTLRRCAWNQHIEMQVWRAILSPAGACLPPGAIAWQRLAAAAQSSPAPWNAAWTSQALFTDGTGIQQAYALWRDADGAWSAALWRWQPSEKPATRAWQQAHWNAVLASAGAYAMPAPAPSPLQQAWLDATAGKARVFDGDTWRWVEHGTCLGLQTAGIIQAQLHLPWSRDDARLEQRSAMQVQLARRFPTADWLVPFTLLEPAAPAAPGARSGAQFIAVWRDGAALDGQLWIPLRDNGGVLRARVNSTLAAQARGDVAVKARADLVEQVLTAIAHAWEKRHD